MRIGSMGRFALVVEPLRPTLSYKSIDRFLWLVWEASLACQRATVSHLDIFRSLLHGKLFLFQFYYLIIMVF